jgi:HTH-type transcriptional regulator/antitoxin HipB
MSSPRPWFRARSAGALGTAIQRARQTAALSQDELADRAGTSRPTLSRLERGASVASSTVLDAAAACGYEFVLVPRGARVTVETADHRDAS